MPTYAKSERGIILVVVLVILVAMTLSSLSLLRSIDTAQLLSGNIGFRRDAATRAVIGLKDVAKQMTKADFLTISTDHCQAGCTAANSRNYVPVLLKTNNYGVPLPLESLSIYLSKFSYVNTASGVSSRYIIERMCSDYGDATAATCILDSVSESGGSQPNDKPGATPVPLFRVTVRADGVRNSLAYAQAIVTIKKN